MTMLIILVAISFVYIVSRVWNLYILDTFITATIEQGYKFAVDHEFNKPNPYYKFLEDVGWGLYTKLWFVTIWNVEGLASKLTTYLKDFDNANH